MRVSKPPEERKAELINASLELFAQKGYKDTMISDIVRRVGVAQGTFYYYFKSKEDMLDPVLQLALSDTLERAERVYYDDAITSVQRLGGLFRVLFSPHGSVEAMARYGRLFADYDVRSKLNAVRFEMLFPIVRAVVTEGTQMGEFRPLIHTDAVVQIILMGAETYMREATRAEDSEATARAGLRALSELMDRALGLPDSTLDFQDRIITRRDIAAR